MSEPIDEASAEKAHCPRHSPLTGLLCARLARVRDTRHACDRLLLAIARRVRPGWLALQ